MPRIPRKRQKIFAGQAANNGVFGSAADNTKILSTDLDVIQSKPAFGLGWLAAVLGIKKFPALEEFQALHYMTTTQIAYLFQEGIAEYNADTTYYQNSIVRQAGTYKLYGSKIDDNTGNSLTDTVSWEFLIDISINSKIPYGFATGTVNNYDVSTSPSFDTLDDGFLFITRINIDNNGPATINPNSIGDLNITVSGASLVGGELKSGADYIFICETGGTSVELLNPTPFQATETAQGVIEIATPAEMIAQNDPSRAATPYNINQLFTAVGRQAVSNPLVQKLPGGLLIQSGTVSIPAEPSSVEVTFPIAYDTDPMVMVGTQILTTTTADHHNMAQVMGTPAKDKFKINNQWFGPTSSPVTNQPIVSHWFSIGFVNEA